MLTKSQILCYS